MRFGGFFAHPLATDPNMYKKKKIYKKIQSNISWVQRPVDKEKYHLLIAIAM